MERLPNTGTHWSPSCRAPIGKIRTANFEKSAEAATGDQSGSPGCANQGSEGVEKMKQTIEANNKAIVLEAFDTLFKKRDDTAAERYWSPNYIQHSAHIAPGREGLFNLIKSLPPTLKYEPGTI